MTSVSHGLHDFPASTASSDVFVGPATVSGKLVVRDLPTVTSKPTSNGSQSILPSLYSSRASVSPPDSRKQRQPCGWIVSWRFRVSVLIHLNLLLVTVLKLNMTVAFVCMVQKPSSNVSILTNVTSHLAEKFGSLNEHDNVERHSVGMLNSSQFAVIEKMETKAIKFQWGSLEQGLVLSSTGALAWISPAMTYSLCRRFGAKRVILAGVFSSGCLTLLMPLGARASPYVLVVLRAIMGFALAVVMPATSDVFAWWSPEREKVSLTSVASAGGNVGKIMSGITSGYLCSASPDHGWSLIFYVHGMLAILVCIVWQLLSSVKPENHHFISEEEKKYIIETRLGMDPQQTKGSPPYRAMFSSPPFWGYMLVMTSHSFATNIVFSYIPLFLSDVLQFNIEQIGLITSIGYGTRFCGVLAFSVISNTLYRRLRLTKTSIRKLVQCSGYYICSTLFIVIGYLHDSTAVLSLLAVIMFFQSVTMTSGLVIPLDIAPRYSGFLSGISLTLGSIVYIPAPVITSIMTSDGTREQWRSVFLMVAAVFAAGATIFLVLGSSDLQPWATGLSKTLTFEKPCRRSSNGIVQQLAVLSLGSPRSPTFTKRSFNFTVGNSYNFNDATIVCHQNDWITRL